MTFDRSFVVNPLCCPSRATILTGRWSGDTGVWYNSPPNGGFATFHESGGEANTIATTLHAAGYATAFDGKYLNGYSTLFADWVPPGWDDACPGAGRGRPGQLGGYYDYELSDEGVLTTRGSGPADYSTDVLAGDATTFIRTTPEGQPLFLEFAPRAPPRRPRRPRDTPMPVRTSSACPAPRRSMSWMSRTSRGTSRRPAC